MSTVIFLATWKHASAWEKQLLGEKVDISNSKSLTHSPTAAFLFIRRRYGISEEVHLFIGLYYQAAADITFTTSKLYLLLQNEMVEGTENKLTQIEHIIKQST